MVTKAVITKRVYCIDLSHASYLVQGDTGDAGQAAAKTAADDAKQAEQASAAPAAGPAASGWGTAPVLGDQPAATQPPQPAGKDAKQSAGRITTEICYMPALVVTEHRSASNSTSAGVCCFNGSCLQRSCV